MGHLRNGMTLYTWSFEMTFKHRSDYILPMISLASVWLVFGSAFERQLTCPPYQVLNIRRSCKNAMTVLILVSRDQTNTDIQFDVSVSLLTIETSYLLWILALSKFHSEKLFWHHISVHEKLAHEKSHQHVLYNNKSKFEKKVILYKSPQVFVFSKIHRGFNNTKSGCTLLYQVNDCPYPIYCLWSFNSIPISGTRSAL